MGQIILIFHILFAVLLVALILIQRGKGASMGVAFGSGASQTVFGSKGSGGALLKITIVLAALFFATSIGLTYLASQQVKHADKSQDVLSEVEQLSKSVKKSKTNQSAPLLKQRSHSKKHGK